MRLIPKGITAAALMKLMMTTTPGGIKLCGFSKESSFWVIQWHVLAMFVPSFFMGMSSSASGLSRSQL
jgi:hypothetical protein